MWQLRMLLAGTLPVMGIVVTAANFACSCCHLPPAAGQAEAGTLNAAATLPGWWAPAACPRSPRPHTRRGSAEEFEAGRDEGRGWGGSCGEQAGDSAVAPAARHKKVGRPAPATPHTFFRSPASSLRSGKLSRASGRVAAADTLAAPAARSTTSSALLRSDMPAVRFRDV